ncbi:MAG TPA: histidinol dehydrogenase [Kiritimatiellia bacterium]|nr:histidinol dehydrogenase [Kiritimatiellia bacterium]HRZ12922.1 histidinol dehydrogenase [Kiritimatiellia bacterium]HSA18468.1 histidinol dehydrogenase [Kiritimatiellia bacterium]
MDIKVTRWSGGNSVPDVDRFLRRPAIDPAAEKKARRVLEEIRQQGDEAVVRFVREFDGAVLEPAGLAVSVEERKATIAQVDVDFKRAATEAHRRIVRFAQAGLRKDWTIATPKGGVLGEQYVPLARVGCYVPAGAAPLASTALMTVTLARVADVREVVACSPAGKEGALDPYLLYSLDLAGATEIYKVGGIQAIGAMAYGTATIRKVQKIVGPGGPYVTAAKRLVYGEVDLDMIAGPSEIAILADDTAPAEYVAADLLSQAEHGTGHEKALLVTPSAALAESVRKELVRQTARLSRREAVERVLEEGTLLVVVDHLDAGMELCNRFAPEHLEIMTREPRRWVSKVRAAGAVFTGAWTPESAGDFVAGPSHVLPTGGTAALFSGLSVDSFRRRSSVISLTRADLQDVLPVIEAFGRVERLDAHAQSARIRFEQK